jgi:hypothetical protein
VNRHRVVTPDGIVERVNRERVFEVVLAVDMATKIPWLGLTAEAITSLGLISRGFADHGVSG